jgi:sodium borate transporter 11
MSRALADIEAQVKEGHSCNIIVKARETRISNLVSNILIGLSIFLMPRYRPRDILITSL